jgi:tRNA (mo5U34)-methyltransferase
VATVAERVHAEPYWFHKIDLGHGVVTPGWNDPARTKLPWFGLPDDLSRSRVLDVGSAEGFFAFEAERRGAAEVIAYDFDPECIKRLAICTEALGSKVDGRVGEVYDLRASILGTFDLVMCFGLLYHLRHPLLALERLRELTSGTLLLQTTTTAIRTMDDVPFAEFRRDGVWSGPQHSISDPTVYWKPNPLCVRQMLEHVGFESVEQLGGQRRRTWRHPRHTRSLSVVFRAR